MKEAFKDYFLSGPWKSFVEDMSAFLDTNLCYLVVDYSENLWTSKNQNPICTLISNSKEGVRLCREDKETMHKRCRESGQIETNKCHMNLTRFVIPIKYDSNSTVYFGMCGIKSHYKIPAKILDHAESLGLDPNEFKRTHKTLTLTPERKLNSFCKILNHLLSSIIELVTMKEALKELITKKESPTD